MSFLGYVFLPKLYKEYGVGRLETLYEPGGIEKWGDQILSTLSVMWNISYYTSPLIITFLYRRGYFVAESITSLAKLSTGIGILVFVSLLMRTIGRSQSKAFSRYAAYLEKSKLVNNEETRKALRKFDFDFKAWPVDFDVQEVEGDGSKNASKPLLKLMSDRTKSVWVSSLPCEIAAYIAIHTFGLRMLYPGSVKLLQNFLHVMLIQGRAKLVEEHQANRFKLKTRDNNEIDTILVDNRQNATNANGKILVICSEGNAGFYEIGIMATPLALNYSVLGWNHPGFGGSTGKPFPDQDQNAIDAVMQFAIHKLGFMPENIVLFGWSIGGYSTLYAASQYPEVRGVILDASFDDVLHLALPRMPESLSGIVRIAIRQYVNLHNSELMKLYNGPVRFIRRTEDEVICSEEMNIATNRGNNLLLGCLKHRFPNIFQTSQISFAKQLLSSPFENTEGSNDVLCQSHLMSYVSENDGKYPLAIGEDYSDEQKNQMAVFLLRRHLLDFKSSHCTPLPGDYFQLPWAIPNDTDDFVFT